MFSLLRGKSILLISKHFVNFILLTIIGQDIQHLNWGVFKKFVQNLIFWKFLKLKYFMLGIRSANLGYCLSIWLLTTVNFFFEFQFLMTLFR